MRSRVELCHTDIPLVWQFLSHIQWPPHWETVSYTEAVFSPFLWILTFPYLLWHAVPPCPSLYLSTESIGSEESAAHTEVTSLSFLEPKPHSSARKSVIICRCTTERKLHPSRFVNKLKALSHSECVDRHLQWYTSILYSSPQLGCRVTPHEESVHTTLHPQLWVIMLWLYNPTGWIWKWQALRTCASCEVTISNKNYVLKV